MSIQTITKIWGKTKGVLGYFIVLGVLSLLFILLSKTIIYLAMGAYWGCTLCVIPIMLITFGEIILAYPFFSFHTMPLLEILPRGYLSLNFLLPLQIIYLCFLTGLIIFIRRHLKGERWKLWMKVIGIFILVVGIILFIIWSLTNIYYTTKVSEAYSIRIPQDCKKAIGPYEYECYVKFASKDDPTICDLLDNPDRISSCYYDVALSRHNSALCEKVIFETEYNKDGICCNFRLAIVNNDSRLCDRLSDTTYYTKELCYAVVKNNLKIQEPASECIPDSLDNYYANLAYATKNPGYWCLKINRTDDHDRCLYWGGVMKFNDSSFCDLMHKQEGFYCDHPFSK